MCSRGDHWERHSIAELRDMARIYRKLGFEHKALELIGAAEKLDQIFTKLEGVDRQPFPEVRDNNYEAGSDA